MDRSKKIYSNDAKGKLFFDEWSGSYMFIYEDASGWVSVNDSQINFIRCSSNFLLPSNWVETSKDEFDKKFNECKMKHADFFK